jgi:hypothetical protein
MSKKFVVALHSSPNLRDPITDHFLGLGWHVWHWYADLWLLSGVPDEITAGDLLLGVEKSVPATLYSSIMAMEVPHDVRFWGRAAKSEAWDWTAEHWGIVDMPTPRPLATISGQGNATGPPEPEASP